MLGREAVGHKIPLDPAFHTSTGRVDRCVLEPACAIAGPVVRCLWRVRHHRLWYRGCLHDIEWLGRREVEVRDRLAARVGSDEIERLGVLVVVLV